MENYLRPATLQQALVALAGKFRAESWSVIAGGTDFFPARVGRFIAEPILDISALNELRSISEADDFYRIGALTTWSDLRAASLPDWFRGLTTASLDIGGIQVQNMGTLAGNICNASPAADGVPNLLVLDAEVELQSIRGMRRVPLAEFIIGSRRTGRRDDELVTALWLKKPDAAARSVFLKLGARRYLVISVVMVAIILVASEDGGSIADLRVSVGACSEVAQRLYALEDYLRGMPCDRGVVEHVSATYLDCLKPIDDVRASAGYRRDAALTLVKRGIMKLIEEVR